jgi:hypothetical protein
MVFMEHSQRAAAIAREHGIDAGLHLNFTTPFTGPEIPAGLLEHQNRLSNFLRRSRFAQVIYHPGLARSFQYVVNTQRDEFGRLYGFLPKRYDGHHHMHLCANVLLGGLLPPETVVRRNFSFLPGEKSFTNRAYRKVVDRILVRRHRLTDFFFSLQPLASPSRLRRIFDLSHRSIVEVETHPYEAAEYSFLTDGGIRKLGSSFPVARSFDISFSENAQGDSCLPSIRIPR